MALRIHHLLTVVSVIAAFNCHREVAFGGDASALVSRYQSDGIAELFDDRVVASNVAAVRQRAARLPDAARFDQLLQWVLPSPTHITIRMNGEFTQTDPAPLNSIGSARMVSVS